MVFFNSQGHNWGSFNNDGYGLFLVVFGSLYTLFFLAACAYLWLNREHPIIRMRNLRLTLSSLLLLHVYLFMVFMVYPLNGHFPCSVEFWSMSLYLPIGIGLFQAQNQQLLIVSREQNELVRKDDKYRPLAGERLHHVGTPRYWMFRFKLWWNSTSKQGKYEGFVFIGICIQFIVALAIYCLNKKYNSYGIIGHPAASPGSCRRGWDWFPSILWQLMWNYFFGPYLLWKIRMIRDIYYWRLQTVLCIVAGLPGTPLWLASVYTDSFGSINKYWPPAMWFLPGLLTMEIATLAFPIVQIRKHARASRDTTQALADFDAKRLTKKAQAGSDSSTLESGSLATRSTGSKGKMFSMETLDECLHGCHDGLQVYASCMELNGENIIFLVKVLKFKKLWRRTFSTANDFLTARSTMFRAALSVFVSLIHPETASYPINIESPIYQKLESIFGHATTLIASRRRGSTSSSPVSQVTPWDDPNEAEPPTITAEARMETFYMKTIMASAKIAQKPSDSDSSSDGGSGKASRDGSAGADGGVITTTVTNVSANPAAPHDPLAGFIVPMEFDAHVFDAAYKSIRYMVWTETWQRYMHWKRTSGTGE